MSKCGQILHETCKQIPNYLYCIVYIVLYFRRYVSYRYEVYYANDQNGADIEKVNQVSKEAINNLL